MMTDVMVRKLSFPFTCPPCHTQPDHQPTTEQQCHQGNQVQEPEDPNHESLELEYKGTKSPPKDRESQAHKTQPELQSTVEVSANRSPDPEPTGENESTITACMTTEKEGGNARSVKRGQAKPHVSLSALEGVSSHKTVFEKWASLQCDEQRPSTKRQLSAESAAKCVSVRKRSTVKSGKEEPAKALPHSAPGTRPRKACLPASSSSQRKPRRQLFSSTAVFHRVDTHAINTGRELKGQGVFSAQSIAHAITQTARNELEKLRAIWVWLCHSIEYDLEGYLGVSPKLCTPDEVIKEGRGLCSGFSSICLEMCREVGIQCEEVSGYSKGIGHRPGCRLAEKPSDHMWNAVWVRGQWGLLDACWGAGTVDMETKSFIKRFDEFYFLTEPAEFINSHFPDDQHWQLLETPLSPEQFELRPLKTSAFYTLGLTLLQPTLYKITTDDGEATVSMSSSRALTFAYELRQRDIQTGAPGQREVDSSCGRLSVTPQGMTLLLLPPEAASYQLKLFARPEGDTEALRWVCSLEVECPTVRQSQPMPANPYVSWGLGGGAGALGVKGCSVPGEEALEVGDGGEAEVVFHTSRPLMMVCELTHPGLDPVLAKRCQALQIAEERLVCHVLCLYKGFYRLSVFVRDYHDASGPFQNAGNFLLHCRGQGANLNSLYPPDLGPWCGPGIRTQAAGLSHFSHTGALVNTPQGCCNITFHRASPEMQIHAVLSTEQAQKDEVNSKQGPNGELLEKTPFPLSRHLLLTYLDVKVTVSVCVPRPGLYRLGLYGRQPPQQDYAPLCDYVVRSTCERHGVPFPQVYAAWGRGCVLLEPRGGVLAPQSCARFRVRVPGARRVSVLAPERAELTMNKSRVWEGEAFTGDATQLKLTAATSEACDMAVLMTFDVLDLEREP
ncbi:kyphoscoliosis peptidase [Electrophorus electricus]|uniref:kyphoscoliosis peptidase n=1 Tax=Electrophorus electricus TaxID=8005 RepID=UPI0015D0144D|nr:kyphoscoliosis peptidase [Electrophorus electricus]